MCEISGNNATLTAYLNAPHVVQEEVDGMMQVTRADVAHCTYTPSSTTP